MNFYCVVFFLCYYFLTPSSFLSRLFIDPLLSFSLLPLNFSNSIYSFIFFSFYLSHKVLNAFSCSFIYILSLYPFPIIPLIFVSYSQFVLEDSNSRDRYSLYFHAPGWLLTVIFFYLFIIILLLGFRLYETRYFPQSQYFISSSCRHFIRSIVNSYLHLSNINRYRKWNANVIYSRWYRRIMRERRKSYLYPDYIISLQSSLLVYYDRDRCRIYRIA